MMKINKMLFVSMLFALPVFAAEGGPGSHAAQREACKTDPQKCRQERMAQREKMCAQNPEKCTEMKAKMEQRRAECKADPEKCRKERQARADEHFKKTDSDGNGTLSRDEAGKNMPRLAQRFDTIDTNKDGQLSRDELSAARKAHRGAHPAKP